MRGGDFAQRIEAIYATVQMSGAGTAATLVAHLTAATRAAPVRLRPGIVIELDEPIDIDFAPFIMSDPANPATLKAAWTPVSTSLADDSTNFILRAQGVASVTELALTSRIRKDERVLNVDDASSLTAGDWLLVDGTNASDDGAYHGPTPMLLEELLRVGSIATNAITLVEPAAQHHGANVADVSRVREIVPILDALVVGIRFDGGVANCAVGLQLDYAYAPTIRIAGANLTKTVWGAVGCRQIDDWHVHEEGNSNAAAFFESCHDVAGSITTDARGGRRNVLGQARGMLTARRRCDNITLRDSVIRHRCCAINVDGGTTLSVVDSDISDIDWTERIADDTECIRADGLTGTAISGALLTGSVQLTPNQYLHDYQFSFKVDGLTLKNCRQPTGTHLQAAAVFVDHYRLDVGRLAVVCGGASGWNGTTHYANGVLFYDITSGSIADLSISGGQYGVILLNAGGRIHIQRMSAMWFDEQGNGYSVFYMADDGNSQLTIDTLMWESRDGYLVLVKSGWNDIGRTSLSIGTLTVQNLQWILDRCFLCKNISGVAFADGEVGEIYEIAAAGAVPALRGVRTPTTDLVLDKVVVVRDVGGAEGWVVCSRGPRRIVSATTAVAIGDWLRVDSGSGTPRVAAVDATKLLPCLGVAVEKTAGAGVVRIG